jgi:multicomponent Na+:H+ antiporter subunit D
VAFGVGKTELEASFKYQVLGRTGLHVDPAGHRIDLLEDQDAEPGRCEDRYWMPDTAGHSEPCHLFIQLLLIAGFGLKAAIIPFHAWLPDAHSSAPSPISAMLSGVLIKAVGIYVLIRLFFNMFAFSQEIALVLDFTLGALSMVAGGPTWPLMQWDLKRLLAYSSISQVGYVVMAIGMGMILLLQKGGIMKLPPSWPSAVAYTT